MEHGGMSCIVVAAIYCTRANHANGSVGLHAFQGTSLHAGGLGTQQVVFSDIEGVLHIQCRMIRRQIQSSKVVVNVLDFGAVTNIKAHAHENLFNFTQSQGYRVQVTQLRLATGQSNINFFVGQLLSQGLLF